MSTCTIIPHAPDRPTASWSCPSTPGLLCSRRSGRSSATLSTSAPTPNGAPTRLTSVRAAPSTTNVTWVAIVDEDVTGFVNVVYN